MKRNIVRFESLTDEVNSIIAKKTSKYSEIFGRVEVYVDEAALRAWEQKVKNLLANVYGKESDFYKDFIDAKKNSFMRTNYEILVKQLKPIFDSAFEDISYHEDNGKESINQMSSKNIFIGHGRSPLWRELKDFIYETLDLPYEEFNRTATAGLAISERLSQMMDSSCFAFLVMTAEDENSEGHKQARMNVIHEVGLFQGKLGFKKAIILLEDGCETFSNIDGIGQIRFPAGNISAVYQQIREVLEREKIILS